METELLGVPSVVLTTKPFVSQARAMSRMRGTPDYGLAIVDHPIVTLDKDGLLERGPDGGAASDSTLSGPVAGEHPARSHWQRTGRQ